jgi:hypothetical protein
LYLVARLGYDRRALVAWTALAWSAMLFSFFCLPAPGTRSPSSLAPVNIDYVFGFSDTAAQTWMPAWAWLTLLLVALPLIICLPVHLLLRRYFSPVRASV